MTGGLYWITGLSGAGKTTIGKLLYKKLKDEGRNVVLFDGDELRQAFGNDLGYSKKEREICAMRYARLCELLARQQVTVICCTISMFQKVRDWNREHIKNYCEIYVEVPKQVLEKRNQKQLYENAKAGKERNVVGVNLELELPQNPDIVICNDGKDSPDEIFTQVFSEICKKYNW